MKSRVIKFLLVFLLCLPFPTAMTTESVHVQASLTNLIKKIPSRPYLAMTGSEFAKRISAMDGLDREHAILDQLVRGNLPDFLKKLKPVQLIDRLEDGKSTTATFFVTPDYLAIGSDNDFLSIPMNLYTAIEVALHFGFTLPTRKMVDAIFSQSFFHLTPEPMPPGPQMRSTQYYVDHNRKIREQRLSLGCPLDTLISGSKKDVVLTNRLARAVGKIAIYGWHRISGTPIQPLTTVHSASYADYSHGIRLVSDIVLIDGEPRSIYDVLEDPRLAKVLSDEGAIPKIRQLMTTRY
jgi:hypothetical protein